jgi:putative transposase
MLSQQGFDDWCRGQGLAENAIAVIQGIRGVGPNRRVGGGKHNVHGTYPSRKMGTMVQFESHRVELAAVYEMERDSDVLEYFDQPPSIPLRYQSKNGMNLSVNHTADFFVLRTVGAGWEECKTEEELLKLAEDSPHRFSPTGNGGWCSPPGEAHAAHFGLHYRVRSSLQINWILQRNIQFLDDYFRAGTAALKTQSQEAVVAQLAVQPGILLADLLLEGCRGLLRDDVYALIASGGIYANLLSDPIWEPTKVRLFETQEAAKAYTRITEATPPVCTTGKVFDAAVGATLWWDSRAWKVVNIGEKMVALLGEDNTFTELPASVAENLVRQEKLKIVSSRQIAPAKDLATCLSGASEEDLQVANRRWDILKDRLQGRSRETKEVVPERTLRSWAARYKQAEAKIGYGYGGLLPRTSQRGNRTNRFSDEVSQLMTQCIENDYETPKQKSKYASWIVFVKACEDANHKAPSYRAFRSAIGKRERFGQVLKRQGHRAAYQHESFHWELQQKTPRHGDRPFEINHIDHTELDLEVVCSQTGRRLGRPWMTILTDAYSRRVLAIHLTFDEPSYRSCMMVLRECVRRHGRLPQVVVVDGGAEFRSTYFETLLARYECTRKTRPPTKARFGSVCERMFGTANTQFVHNLRGNTQMTRNVRQVTKAVDPKGQAVWPIAELYARLCEYFYEIYDTITHPALGESPRDSFQRGFNNTGSRLDRLIPYNQDFLLWTLPTTAKGTAQLLAGRGVKINYIYYWCDQFLDPEIERQQIPVRFDPFDAGKAYAVVRTQWVQCCSEHFTQFEGHTQKELMLASAELHRRRQCHSQQSCVTARKLAEFLQTVEAEEALLLQRLRDRESKRMRDGTLSLSTITQTKDVLDAGTKQNGNDQCNSGSPKETTSIPEQDETYGEF